MQTYHAVGTTATLRLGECVLLRGADVVHPLMQYSSLQESRERKLGVPHLISAERRGVRTGAPVATKFDVAECRWQYTYLPHSSFI